MRILVGTDSRGTSPIPDDWLYHLQQLYQAPIEYTTYRANKECMFFTIYALARNCLNVPDNYYDLTITHSGWHDCVCPWDIDTLKTLVGDDMFDASKLSKVGVSQVSNTTEYQYWDDEGKQEVFHQIHKKSRHVLCIGMHSFRYMETPYGLTPKQLKPNLEYHYDLLSMHQQYSKYADYLDLPMDKSWIGHVQQDNIHCFSSGAKYITDFVHRYINRLGQTLNSLLQERNDTFYQESVKIGNDIAAITHEGDVVLLASSDTDKLCKQFIGCILFGRKPLVIQRPSHKVSNEYFNKKIKHIIDITEATLCLCDKEHIHIYTQFTTSLSKITLIAPAYELYEPQPDDIAFLQLSSGTTGNPKVIEVTHKQVLAQCYEYAHIINLTSEDVVCSWLPLYHDMGLIACFLLPLVVGAKYIHIDPFDWLVNPQLLLDDITQNGGTHVWMPNFAFSYMCERLKDKDLSDIDLSSIKQWINCSEPAFAEDVDKFIHTFESYGLNPVSIKVCYALAENVFAVSQSESLKVFNLDDKPIVSCGTVMPGNSVIIMKDGKDVTDEDIGHVMLKSCYTPKTNMVSDFYGYYNTGDIGFIYEGELYIIGRDSESFISYGVNIYPEIVEHSISQFDEITSGRVACFGCQNAGTMMVTICAESQSNLNSLDLISVTKKIRKYIQSAYGVASSIHIKPPGFIVKTSSGKVNRKLTREKLIDEKHSLPCE